MSSKDSPEKAEQQTMFSVNDLEKGHTSFKVRVFVLQFPILISATLFLAARKISHGDWVSAAALIGIALYSVYALWNVQGTGDTKKPSLVTSLLIVAYVLVRLAIGDFDTYFFLWLYVLPSLCFFQLGPRAGLWVMLALTTGIVFSLYGPFAWTLNRVPLSMKSVVLASWLATLAIAYLTELARADVEERLKKSLGMFARLASVDPLTNLLNRRALSEYLHWEWSRYKRSGTVFSVLLGDVDFFKKVNDTCGHDCGDAVLRMVADQFGSVVRGQDKVARWGGEEFFVLLPDTYREGAHLLAERLRQSIESAEVVFNGQKVKVTMSIGVQEISGLESLEALFLQVDAKLYQAKETGRNRVI